MFKVPLNTLFIGQKIIYLPTCQSTNSYAMDMSEVDVVEGTIIITSHQTAGKGQRGNTWEALPNQNFTFSVILKPHFLPIHKQFELSMIVALGISNFLQKYLPDSVKIKWPNDIFYQNKKICGILIENILKKDVLDKSIIGIGINILQEEFQSNQATSLRKITGEMYDLELLFPELLKNLEEQYLLLINNHSTLIKSNYLAKMFRFNEECKFYSNRLFTGKIVDVDIVGNLIVEVEGEEFKFGMKEISFVY